MIRLGLNLRLVNSSDLRCSGTIFPTKYFVLDNLTINIDIYLHRLNSIQRSPLFIDFYHLFLSVIHHRAFDGHVRGNR